MSGSVNSKWLVALALCAGCWTPPRAVPALPAPLPAEGAPVAAAEFPDVHAPEQPVEAWRIEAGRGFLGAPRVRAHVMVAAHTGRDVTVRETLNGDVYWRRRYRTPITGLTVANGVVYFAERARRGTVRALALENADELWTARVRQARHAPVVVDGMVVFSSDTGELVALDAATGRERWSTPLGATLALPPVRAFDGLLAATTGDTLYLVGPDGSIRGRTSLPATPSAPPLVADSTVILPLHDRSVVTLDARLDVHSVAPLDDVVLAQPVHDGTGGVVLLTRAGELVRLHAGTSEPLAQLGGAATHSLARVADGYVVGLLDGTVALMDENGAIRWRHSVEDSVDEPVAAEEGALYVATRRGSLVKLVNG